MLRAVEAHSKSITTEGTAGHGGHREDTYLLVK